MTLHHLTLNTGHVARTERADVADDVIALLHPLAQAGGAWLPGPQPWWLEVAPHYGWAEFHIASGPALSAGLRSYAACVGCWLPSADPWAVTTLAMLARVAGVAWEPVPLPIPWLGVALTPEIAGLSPAAAGMLGDLERVIFWTIVERSA